MLRRIKVNELPGNADAHLKTFNLLYDDAARTPRLSPAYDIVAYAAYVGNHGHSLKFQRAQKERTNVLPGALRQRSNAWRIQENTFKNAVAETVDAAMRAWPTMIDGANIDPSQKQRLPADLNDNPSAVAWRTWHLGS